MALVLPSPRMPHSQLRSDLLAAEDQQQLPEKSPVDPVVPSDQGKGGRGIVRTLLLSLGLTPPSLPR